MGPNTTANTCPTTTTSTIDDDSIRKINATTKPTASTAPMETNNDDPIYKLSQMQTHIQLERLEELTLTTLYKG